MRVPPANLEVWRGLARACWALAGGGAFVLLLCSEYSLPVALVFLLVGLGCVFHGIPKGRSVED